MGVASSVAATFNTPMLTGGPASVTWCWLIGSFMCLALGASIAEIVSAFPTCQFLRFLKSLSAYMGFLRYRWWIVSFLWNVCVDALMK
jgi:amino acid permease